MNYKLLVLLIFSFFLLNFNLGKWGIMETSEARYSQISKEMLENKDFVHPKLLGIYHYHKPPLTYQITSLGYKIFGINEFGARFFIQVAIIFQLLLIYKIAINLFSDKSIALNATLIYFSLPIVLISSRNLTTDAYLNTFILLSIWSWLQWKIKNQRPLFLYLFFVALGMSFEIKGPVSLIFPVVFIIVYKVILKESWKISLHNVLGFALFLFIAAFWFLLVAYENENLWDYFIKDQIADRISSKSYNRGKPFWFYLLTVPLLSIPWTFIWMHKMITKSENSKKFNNKESVLWMTILILILIFSIFKTKLILYVLPMFGFVAVAVANGINHYQKKTRKIINNIIIAITAIFLVSILTLSFLESVWVFPKLDAIIITTLSFCLISIALFVVDKNQTLRTGYLGYIFGATLLFSGNQFLINNESRLNSPKQAIRFIEENLNETKNILAFNYLISSAGFYSERNLITLNHGHNTVQRETQFENDSKWKENLIDVKTAKGLERTKILLKDNSVVIMRKRDEKSKFVKVIEQELNNKKQFGNYIVYF